MMHMKSDKVCKNITISQNKELILLNRYQNHNNNNNSGLDPVKYTTLLYIKPCIILKEN